MTTYVVLLETPAPEGVVHGVPSYIVTGRHDAHSAAAACREAAVDLIDDQLDAGVVLIAVPARNWQHVALRAQVERRVVRS